MLALAFPAAASALTFEVDSTADEADAASGGECKTAAEACTLRAAIEESNASAATDDEITFGPSFDGALADTIVLSETPFPAITDTVAIDGDGAGQCTTAAGRPGPCVAISGGGLEQGLVVDADGVLIEGLAVFHAETGIDVAAGATSFEAYDNWIGPRLDGAAGGNGIGLAIRPEANEAIIGGAAASQRNVIAHNETGLLILGADDTQVSGNYFGVRPNGVAQALNSRSLVILDTGDGTFEANDTVVGETIAGPALSSDACDGGCNLFSGTQFAVGFTDQLIQGASGPTTVKGNQFGLGADGATTVAPVGMIAVQAHEGADLTVGGAEAGDGNVFSGGGYGIHSTVETPRLEVLNNRFGLAADGDPVPAVGGTAISVNPGGGGDFDEGAVVAGNSLRMEDGWAIEMFGDGAEIAGNHVTGADFGIEVYGAAEALGNLIEGNLIEDSGVHGIRVSSNLNVATGNTVLGSGEAGVVVKKVGSPVDTTGNRIGGDSPSEENEISGSGGAAIEIVGYEAAQNEVARNRGAGNSGLFIDLKSADPSTDPFGPSAGIQPPQISAASATQASGTALPGARVRVFRKASPEAGELAAFVGEAVAGPGGGWSVTYPALPGVTIVAASQTNTLGGTSEISTATTPPDPVVVCVCPPPPPGDTLAPKAKILKAPPKKTTKTTVKFKFSSNEAGSTFQCKLDKGKFKSCKSPKTYRKLKPGKHLFKVRAIDKAGNVGKPAKRKFRVLG